MKLPDFFAVDIGNHSIKIVEVRRSSPDKARLEHIGKISTSFGLLDNDSEEGMQTLADKLNEAREAAGIRTNKFVAAVPESSVFSRLITVPKVEESKVEDAVYWELKPMIPVPLENVDIAYLEIGEKEVAGQQLVDMYVVAAPKALTDRFRKIASLAKLELLALETEALATVRAVKFARPDIQGDSVVIDFGAYGTNMILSRDGVVIFSQTSSTGSDALTKAIASDYSIDYTEAEKYKRAFGIDPTQGEGKVAKSIEPIMQIMVSDMIRTLNYFKERVSGKLTGKIYLVGDGANLVGLTNYISQKLGLQAEIVDILGLLEMDNATKKAAEQFAPSGMAVAVGLGLKTTED